MLKRIVISFLVILVIGFTFVSCDSDNSKSNPDFNARTTPLSLENYGSSDLKVTIKVFNSAANDSKLKYSIDDGEIQTVSLIADTEITVPAGGTISFYDDRSNTTSASYTIKCDTECYVYGNVMSLINSTDFKDLTSLENLAYSFAALFYENTKIKNHPSKPLVLPATTLANNCYHRMFQGCTGLTQAPELPATTLANECYVAMFHSCTGLTETPVLPATELKPACYYQMFIDCTGLTEAPVLKAEELVTRCYALMFSGCMNINKVICHATSDNGTASTTNWLNGVASTGTFSRPATASFWVSDSPSGIPNGWTTTDL
ncbi:MAG: hypothetical protein IJ836_08810 [Spirochaetales bacterium]|nr:hypothetical protein [Spirochaetales bacterium]